MIAARHPAIGALGFVLCTQLLYGLSGPHYREFQLGGDLASVSREQSRISPLTGQAARQWTWRSK